MNLLFFSLLATSPLPSGSPEELNDLHHLLEMTRENLKIQEELYAEVANYNKLREAFLANSENRKLASRLVKSAVSITKKIEKDHLDYLFPSAFIEEVHTFAALAK